MKERPSTSLCLCTMEKEPGDADDCRRVAGSKLVQGPEQTPPLFPVQFYREIPITKKEKVTAYAESGPSLAAEFKGGLVKKYLLDAIIKPLLAASFFLGFGGFFLFGGFQSVTVDLERDADQAINGKLTRTHLLGLYTASTSLKGVTKAGIETRRGTASYRTPIALLSGVVIESESGQTSLFSGFSSFDDNYKRQITDKLNGYIRTGSATAFSERFAIRNAFGWVGLPFFLLGVLGVLGWPKALVTLWRKNAGKGTYN